MGEVEYIAATSECKMFSYLAKNMVEAGPAGGSVAVAYKFKIILENDISMDELKLALEVANRWAKAKPVGVSYSSTLGSAPGSSPRLALGPDLGLGLEMDKFLRTLEVLTYLGAPTELQQNFVNRFILMERQEKTK